MDVHFAVFNISQSERRRARQKFIEKHGVEAYGRYIAPYWKRGIMSLFGDEPTPFTVDWVNLASEMTCKRLGEDFEPAKLP